MDSQRLPKRQSLSPETTRSRPGTHGAKPGAWTRLPLLVTLLILSGVAGYTSWALQRELERGVAEELKLILAAEVEVAQVLIEQREQLASSVTRDPAALLNAQRALFVLALTRLPVLSRVGRSGETYAFDKQGVMLTPSRFDDELREQDLLLRRGDQLVVELRDPGGHVAAGYRPTLPREAQPLTKLAQVATSGRDGVDVLGYRDYRGVTVVGAWRWLPQYQLGVAVEIDASEAFALHRGLRAALFAVYLAMALALLAVGGSSRVYVRARTQIEHAKQLGQYTLVRELGRGGMGTVYEARHALLRRPTAVKLMAHGAADPLLDAESLLRFEREVQLTSQLTHPNTIVIYDYGRTDDGIFYYAMEYVDGVNLDQLVKLDGPLPAGRVIHFALQVCGSLTEAHAQNLIHRDIKPANILVCERGAVPDCIKVLDFGLVKSVVGPQVSAAHVLVGTPQFMAPEVLRDPSTATAGSDLFALGAVLYWLTTGRTIVDEHSALHVLREHAVVAPPSLLCPSLPHDLDRVIMRCLARDPAQRPVDMAELASELRACRAHGSWSEQDARRYWRERGSLLVRERPAAPDVPTLAAS